jgi:uncharacterized membrane protein
MSFVGFEVALGNSSYLKSIKRSTYYVSKNFWGIFYRYVIIIVLTLLITITINVIFGEKNVGGSILGSIISAVFGWFSLCYNLTIYKQARAGIEDSQGKLSWAIIIGILGWIIGIVIIIAAVTFISQLPKESSDNIDVMDQEQVQLENIEEPI